MCAYVCGGVRGGAKEKKGVKTGGGKKRRGGRKVGLGIFRGVGGCFL